MIRPVEPGDLPAVLSLIHDLAEYERAAHEVVNTVDELHRHLFADQPAVFGHVATHEGQIAGVALWFLTYSTWTGRHGIHLEDLFVRPQFRGHGFGKALMRTLATIAGERGYSRFEWNVLDWNEPAIAFYESIGARHQDEWLTYRLSGPALHDLATASGPVTGTGKR